MKAATGIETAPVSVSDNIPLLKTETAKTSSSRMLIVALQSQMGDVSPFIAYGEDQTWLPSLGFDIRILKEKIGTSNK